MLYGQNLYNVSTLSARDRETYTTHIQPKHETEDINYNECNSEIMDKIF